MKDRENMNKILPYIVIAILLGTVTMVVPYSLLGSNDLASPTEDNTLQTSEPEKQDNQDRAYIEGGDLENGDTYAPTPTPEGPSEPEEPEPCELEAFETNFIIKSLLALSQIGLLVIPSFLIALGAFVYLKKRM